MPPRFARAPPATLENEDDEGDHAEDEYDRGE